VNRFVSDVFENNKYFHILSIKYGDEAIPKSQSLGSGSWLFVRICMHLLFALDINSGCLLPDEDLDANNRRADNEDPRSATCQC
jgi:hypothetical protein